MQARRTIQREGERVDEQLVGIEPQPPCRIEGAVGAKTVARPGRDVANMSVEDGARAACQWHAPQLDLAGPIEQTELDPPSVRRMHRHVHAARRQGHAQGLGQALRPAVGHAQSLRAAISSR